MERNDNLLQAQLAEKAVLSSILFKTKVILDVVDIDSLETDLFFTHEAKRIFQAVKRMERFDGSYDYNIFLFKLKDLCSNNTEFEACQRYINSFPRFGFFGIESNIELLKAYSIDRKFKSLCSNIVKYNLVPEGFDDQVNAWEKKFKNICSDYKPSVNFLTTADVIKEWNIASQKNKDSGGIDFFRTGYRRLDEVLKFLRGGQLVVLASRPGMGKTTFALNILKNNFSSLNKDIPFSKAIGFFSLEMHHQELMTKLLAIEAETDLYVVKKMLEGNLVNRKESEAIKKAQERICKLNILFCDKTTVTVGNIISYVKSWIREHNLKLVIIDYLQLIVPHKDKDDIQQYQKIGEISRSLKLFAMEMDVCILALAQLNRKVEERRSSDKAPILSDLRESGSIEQDADIVMFLYEDKVDELLEEACQYDKGTFIKVAKNRHGPTEVIEFNFHKNKGLFTQLII